MIFIHYGDNMGTTCERLMPEIKGLQHRVVLSVGVRCRIVKMLNILAPLERRVGRTHLGCKVEYVVDLDTAMILHTGVYSVDEADTKTLLPSVIAAHTNCTEACIHGGNLPCEIKVESPKPTASNRNCGANYTTKGFCLTSLIRTTNPKQTHR